MSLFAKLTNEGLQETEDRLGGSYGPIDSDVYLGTVKMAYAGESAGGAKSVSLILDINGKEYREIFYITNKKGENFFFNKDDKSKKVPLPGFTTIDDLFLICLEQPIAEADWEEKVVKIYDYEAKKELPKSVMVPVELLGKSAYFAITRNLEDKNAKDASGEYVPTGEVRETNTIEKIFHPEMKVTVPEARNGKEADFMPRWIERNKGIVRDKTAGKKGGQASGKPGVLSGPPKANEPTKPAARPSLFAKKS